MSARLVAEEGILKGLILPLEDGEQWVIGRDPDGCQLLVEDPAASRKHLICRVTPDGILLENLSSTNPVQVNDEEVEQPRLLHNGDAVRIGSGMFRFYEGEEAKLIQDLQIPSPSLESSANNNQALETPMPLTEDLDTQSSAPAASPTEETAASNPTPAPTEEYDSIFDEYEEYNEQPAARQPTQQEEEEVGPEEDFEIDLDLNTAPDPVKQDSIFKEIDEAPVEEKEEPQVDEIKQPTADPEQEIPLPEENTLSTPPQEPVKQAPLEDIEEFDSIFEDSDEPINLDMSSKITQEDKEENVAPEELSIAEQLSDEEEPVLEESAPILEEKEEELSEKSSPQALVEEELPGTTIEEPLAEEENAAELHSDQSPVEHSEEQNQQEHEEEKEEKVAVAPLEDEDAPPIAADAPTPEPLEEEEQVLPKGPFQQDNNNFTPETSSMLEARANEPSVNSATSLAESPREPSRYSIFREQQSTDLPEDILAEINFDMVDTGRWLLKVVGGPNNGAEFSMQQESSYVIGTDPNSCDIILHDNSVSRQHARLIINDDETITIEDLKSRNGTIVDGEALHGSRPLPTNVMVTLGTTSFIVFDREGEMQTIIAPLLPSIVKVLQKGEAEEHSDEPTEALDMEPQSVAQEISPDSKSHTAMGAFILIGIIVGLFVIVGIGMTMLFRNEPIQVAEQVDSTKAIADALSPFPTVKWSFNKTTGRLLLVGHVLTGSDKNQLMYNLQGMKFIKHIDDSGIVIDEYVWREFNQVLEKNPQWKGITLYSPTPGHFVISGNLQTKVQSEKLSDYLTANFPYLDLLDRRVVVEEEVLSSVNSALQTLNLRDVSVQLNGGDLTLVGAIPASKTQDFDAALAEFKQLPGIRGVRNLVTQQAPEASVINISDKYEVSGYSQSGKNVNVIVNGRILTVGDTLDGMNLTSIKSNTILLEKDGVKYKIDFSR